MVNEMAMLTPKLDIADLFPLICNFPCMTSTKPFLLTEYTSETLV